MQTIIDRRDLTFKALAGLFGGVVGWLPIELALHNSHLGEAQTAGRVVAYYISSALAAGAIGAFITAVDSSAVRVTPEAKRRFVRGFAICAVLSLLSTWLANYVFNWVLQAGGVGFSTNGELISGSSITLVIGRFLGWAIDGALVGAGVGLATLTMENVPKGFVGGLVGGAVGGIGFDLIVGGGLASRFFGEAVTGLAIGLFIGLVQELTKAGWVTVEQGRLRGRQYRIEGAHASIGRAEENPVGLFGDPSVQPRHAVIERRGANYVIRNLAVQNGTFVNGSRIETVELHDGDRIRIGGYEIMFHLRGTSAAGRPQGSPTGDRVNPAPAAVYPSGAKSKVDGPSLIDASGQPHAVRTGAVTRIGRALDNDLVVPHESISRHHATIAMIDGVYCLQDLQSQNGTYVDGNRVGQAPLKDGNTIRLGDALFQFRG